MRILRRVWAETIWHPDAISAWEGQAARDLKRVILPLLDVFLVCMGIYAVHRGMPSFAIVWDEHLSDIAGWGLLVSALLALAGISFPRLWIAEAIGKLFILAVLAGYAIALGALDLIGQGDRGLVAFAFGALALLPGWNLIRLGRERQARKAAKVAKAVR